MTVVAGSVLGVLLGALVTSFGLIDTSAGSIDLHDGNEWTPFVMGAGAIAGLVIGRTAFARRHAYSFLLLGTGLVLATVIRDRYFLQPPAVFVALFGIPALSAAAGVTLDRWRTEHAWPRAIAISVGLAIVAAAAATTLALRATDHASKNCETVEGVTRCTFGQ